MSSTNTIDLQSLIDLQKNYVLNLQRIPTGGQNNTSVQSNVTELNKLLVDLQSAYENSSSSASDLVLNQDDIYNILQTENVRLENEEKNVNAAITGQKRMMQINNSYGARYTEWNKIFIVIVITCIIAILIHYENKVFGIIPEALRTIISIITIGVSIFIVVLLLLKIASRDNMDFDKLKNPPPPDTSSSDDSGATTDEDGDQDLTDTAVACSGAQCCSDGMTYDSAQNVCVEGFNPNVKLNKRA